MEINVFVIVIARVRGIYGSKLPESEGKAPRTRAVYDMTILTGRYGSYRPAVAMDTRPSGIYNIGVGTMGAPGAGAPPPMFSDSYIARLNFLYTLIILPLPIEPPFTKPSSYASV